MAEGLEGEDSVESLVGSDGGSEVPQSAEGTVQRQMYAPRLTALVFEAERAFLCQRYQRSTDEGGQEVYLIIKGKK